MFFLTKVKVLFKKYFDRIHNEKVKINLLQAIPFWIASIATGLCAVLYTKLFAFAEKGTSYIMLHFNWSFFIITPLCFILSWWLVKRFAPFARGSGIPQVMAAIEIASPKNKEKLDKLLSIKIVFVKVISSLVLVLGGGAIGREGPTIHVAGSIFQKINSWLPAWWPKIAKKNMIMTGAAAGLAAAFNTPLGGIVFAVEELSKTHISFFKSALFTAVIISGLTAQALLGPYLYLGYPNVSGSTPYIFMLLILVAIVAGLAASIMSKIMLKIFKWKRTFKKSLHHILFLAVCASIMAAFAFFLNKKIFGSGKELMTHILFTNDKEVHWYIPILRIIGPIFSFTSGAAGGVFAPALSAGATIGALISSWFEFSAANSNLLILAGMVAFLTGVTRTPFTSAILVLEMTDGHNVIFQLMLAGMVASTVSLLIDKHSLYDHLKEQYIEELG